VEPSKASNAVLSGALQSPIGLSDAGEAERCQALPDIATRSRHSLAKRIPALTSLAQQAQPSVPNRCPVLHTSVLQSEAIQSRHSQVARTIAVFSTHIVAKQAPQLSAFGIVKLCMT
jgi:hypothetical protein